MSNLLAARFANTPVMVSACRAAWLSDCVHAASGEIEKINARESAAPAVMQDDFWPAADSWKCAYRPYNVVDGTLIIPIKGVLLHDFGYQIYDWATGYIYIQKAFERGMADYGVRRIALLINSGGGDVAGNFDLVDRMFALRGTKPVQAFVNEHAYSAAFSIASVADKITMPRTGGDGSVGVLTSHVDVSGALDKNGYKITLIFAGEHKVDGNAYEALPAPVKARIQKRIDSMRLLFAQTVARNLGMTVEAVLATEAQTYSADEAVAVGFAHEIRPVDEALAAYCCDQEETTEDDEEEDEMATEQTAEQIQAGLDAARADGQKEGALAERTRIQGILTNEAAAERSALASHIAMNTDMPVDAAVAMLNASPKVAAVAPAATTAAPASGFEAAMANGNPNIAPTGGEPSTAQQAQDEFRAATGYGSTK
jgi:ClpP class serine protease